MEIVVTLWYGP